MIKLEQFYFVSFENTNSAMEAEDYLKENSFNVTVIPTPREITQSCGISIRFNASGIETIKEILHSGNISIKGIYKFITDNEKRAIEKIG
mgnify:CR=1 FL=1